MTISSTTNRVVYTGNGATSAYSYSFRIAANTDLLIKVMDTNYNVTTLTLTTDYTVSGVGAGSGGTVTLVNASQAWLTSGSLKNNYKLMIRRKRPFTQTSDIRNQGTYYPETHENLYDYAVMMAQYLDDNTSRSVRIPEFIETTAFDPVFSAEIAGTVSACPATNASGNGWADPSDWPTTTAISGASASATAAAASATAAASSASSASTSATAAASSATSAASSATSAAASAASIGTRTQETPSGTVNSSNTVFTLAHTPVASASVLLFLDGFFQRQGTDYTISGTTITFTSAPETGQTVDATYRY